MSLILTRLLRLSYDHYTLGTSVIVFIALKQNINYFWRGSHKTVDLFFGSRAKHLKTLFAKFNTFGLTWLPINFFSWPHWPNRKLSVLTVCFIQSEKIWKLRLLNWQKFTPSYHPYSLISTPYILWLSKGAAVGFCSLSSPSLGPSLRLPK